ncbi:hypothetical protein [Ochrobactrum sp. S1502_03]|uniref:hypothetical protein n=1 Tax=Ochrobactrum sp. S1502_03 TaxID=3108451 RepID=UPI0037C71AD9
MPVVKMPDGTNVRFPDDMPHEQIREMISSKFPDADRNARLERSAAQPQRGPMAKFEITTPDGSIYEVEGANDEQGAWQALQQHLGQQRAIPAQQNQNGFGTAPLADQRQARPVSKLSEMRQRYPQYNDMSDQQFADAFHQKFYSDMPQADFYSKLGFNPQPIEQPADERDSILGRVDAAVRGAADTLTFGFSDEIAAGLGTGFGMLGDYDQELARQRGIDASDSENRFGYRLGGQLAGGVTSGVGLAKNGLSLGANAINNGAGLGKVALASGIEGAGLGGLHGFGSGEGVEGRIGSGTVGAIGGGIIGAAAPVAIAGASGFAKPYIAQVGAMFNPDKYASRAIGEGLRRSGNTADDIAAMITGARADGQGMFTVADAMGNSGQRMLSTAARNPNGMRQVIAETLDARQAGQGRRIANALSEGFDAADTAAQRAARLTAERSTQAAQNYGAARAGSGAVDPTAAINAADDFLTPGASKVFNPGNNIADDSIEAAVRRARGYLTDGNSVLTDFNAAFRAKMELDSMIEGAKPAVQSQLIPIRNALDGALEKASPYYANARNTFRQQSKAIDAIETGRTAATRGRYEDTIPTFNAMSPEEQAAFRAGYSDPLIAQTQGAAIGVNKARPLINDATNAEFPAFAAPGKSAQLQNRIARENTMFETRNAALGGSKTADNLADAADMGRYDTGILSTLAQGRPFAAAAQGVASLLNAGRGQPQSVTERIAKAMMETDPDIARTLLEGSTWQLTKSEAYIALVNAISGNMGAAGVPRLLGQEKRAPLEITVGRPRG